MEKAIGNNCVSQNQIFQVVVILISQKMLSNVELANRQHERVHLKISELDPTTEMMTNKLNDSVRPHGYFIGSNNLLC